MVARPNVTAMTDRAPAASRAWAAAPRVAPVVKTSSTKINVEFGMRNAESTADNSFRIPHSPFRIANAPATFARREAGVNVVWVTVSRVRTSSSATGCPQRAPRPRARSALWLYPRVRCRRGPSGTGTRTAAWPSGIGRVTRAAAAARSSAMRGRPPYLRAWTARRAAASSQTADRAQRRAAGQSAQTRQRPNRGSGCPQRSHQGGTTGRQRCRHSGQTRSRERSNGSNARHSRHSAGNSSCSRALAAELPGEGGTHHLRRGLSLGEESSERRDALLEQHFPAVLCRHASRAEGAHPPRLPRGVDEVESGAQPRGSGGLERQGIPFLEAQRRRVDRHV